jgi:glutamine amidotransferase
MSKVSTRHVAVVDYEMGNLFSVLQTCRAASLDAFTTQSVAEVATADMVILPGVGGFPQAMASLRQRGLDVALRQYAASGRPIVGVCLGQQLLMDYSDEFARTEGLGLIAGNVVKLPVEQDHNGRALKIPHMGWVPIRPSEQGQSWSKTPLDGVDVGASMYLHSYQAVPSDPADILAVSPFGHTTFCASVHRGNVYGFQFHPERSDQAGLHIYKNFAAQLVAGQ